ncbi:MAG TPA: SRPBCC family protein [Alphaproteobacteria bacterium]
MSEYERTIAIQASPDRVFEFVADIRNMTRYMPTATRVQGLGDSRVRVEGEAHGHRYVSDGWMRIDGSRRRLEWGADEGDYSGWLQVREDGSRSEVTIHLTMRRDQTRADRRGRLSDNEVMDGLMTSLQSIRNHLEGQGGKVEPAAATSGSGD